METPGDILAEVQESKVPLPESECTKVVTSQSVQWISAGRQRTPSYLILTPYHFYLFARGSGRANLKQIQASLWNTVSALSVSKDRETVTFTIDGHPVSLFIPTASDFIPALASYLLSILNRSEFPPDSLTGPAGLFDRLELAPNRFMARLRFSAYVSNLTLPDRFVATLRDLTDQQLLASKDPGDGTLDISDFIQYQQEFPLIFDALSVFPEIFHLIVSVPSDEQGWVWPLVSNFLRVNNTVTIFEAGHLTHDIFRETVRPLRDRGFHPIHTFACSDIDFDRLFMVELAILVEIAPVVSLSLRNQMTEAGLETLLKLLQSVNGFKRLRALEFAGCPLARAASILEALPRLRSFRWADPVIEIGAVLTGLCSVPDCEIEEITLSYGTCLGEIAADLRLPPRLRQIAITDTGWQAAGLRAFLELVTKTEQIGLNLNGTCLQDDSWSEIDEFMAGLEFAGLSSFSFDENPIGPGLLKWIGRNLGLVELSLNCCVWAFEGVGESLREILRSSVALRRFSFRGKAPVPYAAEIPGVLAGVLENGSLHELDIENNRAGAIVVEKLREIIDVHPVINKVWFDGSEGEDWRGILDLFELAKTKDRSILLKHPTRDVSALRASAKISDGDVARIKNQWRESLRPFCPQCLPLFFNTVEETPVADFPVELVTPGEAGCPLPEVGEEIDRLNRELISDVKWRSEFPGVPDVDLDPFLDSARAQFDCEKLLKSLN
jgi:hypothetical protein